MTTMYHEESVRRIAIFIRAALTVSVNLQTYKPLVTILEDRYKIKFTEEFLELINVGVSIKELAEFVSCLAQRNYIFKPSPELELYQTVYLPTKYWYRKSIVIKIEPFYLIEPERFSKYFYYVNKRESVAIFNKDVFISRLAVLKHKLGFLLNELFN